ncbi:MAG: DNA adenine methylase [Methanomicrobiales archaeon]|nr:DNA adenine methylase [Methanomicrobiales archaeon]
MITPLIKWAGGKRQLRTHLVSLLPARWDTYYEPFIGGGALLVELANLDRLSTAVIGDKNPELVNLYTVVRDMPDALSGELEQEKFQNDEGSFNRLRTEFNALAPGTRSKNHAVERAALLIYLNKHSYNGLWRVNRKGHYNVPFGRHKKLSLPSPASLQRFSRMLQGISIINADFSRVVKNAGQDDFIYFDPPYHPVSKTAAFTDYTTGGFTIRDQERLARLYGRLSDTGAKVMLSNSRVEEIEELYADFHIHTVEAKRFINCNGQKRTGMFEIIVTNYEKGE